MFFFCLLTKFLDLLTILKTIINAVKLVILTDSQWSWFTDFTIVTKWFLLDSPVSLILSFPLTFLHHSRCIPHSLLLPLPYFLFPPFSYFLRRTSAASWQSQRKYALAFGFDNAVASSGESISNEQRFGRTSHCKYLYLPLWRETFYLYLNCE